MHVHIRAALSQAQGQMHCAVMRQPIVVHFGCALCGAEIGHGLLIDQRLTRLTPLSPRSEESRPAPSQQPTLPAASSSVSDASS
eukprot:2876806-Rhodomonas_salina.1